MSSTLSGNSSWAGSAGASLSIGAGTLSYSGLRDISPAGYRLQVTGAGSRNNYRAFAGSAITNGNVYVSALINCSVVPTNSQFVMALLASGVTSPNQPDDPLDVYVTTGTNGYRLQVGHTGDDPATARVLLTPNATHLIVLKYAFGGVGRSSLYIDPTPGAPEPATPDAATQSNEGNPTATLQNLLFHSPANVYQGVWSIDTVRVGTNWPDVTPPLLPLSLSGPANVPLCAGNSAVFSIVPSGTEPFHFQWQTNGRPVLGATNSSFTVVNPNTAAAAIDYSIVVSDAFSSVTSGVAKLLISTAAPQITIPPTNRVITAGSDAVFTVAAAPDPALLYQWRTNGMPVPDATNNSFTVRAATSIDALNAFDVVVSNPCGSITSRPVAIFIPQPFFNCEGVPGFFGGLNLIMTNISGVTMFAWSTEDATLPVSSWYLEGQMFEQSLGDGTSRYTINVNPLIDTVFYVAGQSVAGPYVNPAAIQWITITPLGDYSFTITNLPISMLGVFQVPGPPTIATNPASVTVLAGKSAAFIIVCTGAEPLSYQWTFAGSNVPNETNTTLVLTTASAANAGDYCVVITNAYGSVTSAPAALVIQSPPRVQIKPAGQSLQITANGIPGDIYWVQAATNLTAPNWNIIASALVPSNGLVKFTDATVSGTPKKFYRLAFPTMVSSSPQVFQPLVPASVLVGKSTSFAIGATGSYPLSYYWYFNSNSLTAESNAAVTINGANLANAGTYTVVITNAYGSVTNSASLAVLPQPVLKAQAGTGGLRIRGEGVPGDVYIVQSASNLLAPAWVNIATGAVPANGSFETRVPSATGGSRFFRVVFP